MAMVIEISSDSEHWLKLKHAMRATGQRYYFQQNLFDANRVSLFLEDVPEPEGGQLVHSLIVYDGGVGKSSGFSMDSKVFEVYQQETSEQPYLIQEKPAVKSSTNVASASTVCGTCGCRLGRGQVNTKNCQCNCHGTDRRPEGVAS
jgi:hypothetical protein